VRLNLKGEGLPVDVKSGPSACVVGPGIGATRRRHLHGRQGRAGRPADAPSHEFAPYLIFNAMEDAFPC
jgi:hypothetical protein